VINYKRFIVLVCLFFVLEVCLILFPDPALADVERVPLNLDILKERINSPSSTRWSFKH
jgi:hypothetical protein